MALTEKQQYFCDVFAKNFKRVRWGGVIFFLVFLLFLFILSTNQDIPYMKWIGFGALILIVIYIRLHKYLALMMTNKIVLEKYPGPYSDEDLDAIDQQLKSKSKLRKGF